MSGGGMSKDTAFNVPPFDMRSSVFNVRYCFRTRIFASRSSIKHQRVKLD
jgi:hypothetical protein